MQKTAYFHRVHDQTATRFWINNVTRNEAHLAIEQGAVGCTQNPSYVYKMLTSAGEDAEWALAKLDSALSACGDNDKALATLQRDLIADIAGIFSPMYEKSGGLEGFVSIQGDPFREDAATIIENAEFNREAGNNIMAKIPVTADGLEAIAKLAAKGVPINETEVFAVRQALDVCETYEKATRGFAGRAPIYLSHIAGIFDEYILETARRDGVDLPADYLWQAGITVAKKIHALTRERGLPVGFISGGARGLHHFTEMVGADACVTINWVGAADELIRQDPPVVQRFKAPAPHEVIDGLCRALPDFLKAYFADGIEPGEYEHYGPVVKFREMFENAWADARELTARRRG